MKTERINNAAGRLLQLLRKIRSHEKDENNAARNVWAEILDVPSDDLPALLRRMAMVIQLPEQAEREVRQIPGVRHDQPLAWRQRVAEIISQLDFRAQFSGITKLIDEPILALLEICDELIEQNSPALSIDRESLNDLLKEVRKVIDMVNMSLRGELAGFILRHLHTIEQSIVDYELQGIEALRTGLETTVGIARVNPQPFDDALKSPIGQYLAKILGTYVLILSGFYGTRQLGEDLVKLLPGVDAIQAEEAPEAEVVSGEPTGAAVEQEGAGS